MISLSKMNKILDYDTDNFVVRVQPGVLLQTPLQTLSNMISSTRRIRAKSSHSSEATYRPMPAACAPSSTARPATMSER